MYVTELDPDKRYWCCRCPRRFTGALMAVHMASMHPEVSESGLHVFTQDVRRARPKAPKDLPGQTFFGFLGEHRRVRASEND